MSKCNIVFSENIGDFKKEVRNILEKNDEEFVPPLSTRILDGESDNVEFDRDSDRDISNFFQECLDHQYIFSIREDKLAGFLSFKNHFESDYLDGYNPSNHVSVIVVEEEYRREGLAEAMYNKLLTNIPRKYKMPYITTITWSSNKAHTNLLEKLGFEKVTKIENDRGKDIDTLYFGLEID